METGAKICYISAMLGYVTCETAELKVREFELYGGYYCGVCKAAAKRYGQLPRAVLSYDSAFLALLLAGAADEKPDITHEHCITHHIKKKTIVSSPAVDYAADVMVMLAGFKTMDDVKDEGGLKARSIDLLMKPYFRKACGKRPEICEDIRQGIEKLSRLEEERSASLDETGMAFGEIMGRILSKYGPAEGQKRILESMGMHLGRWIYLIDAFDDIEENMESGAYNPLFCRFGLEKGESKEDFSKRIHNDMERNLTLYLANIADAFDLLEMKRNRSIVENIVYMGLLRQTDDVLCGKRKEKKSKR